MTSVGGIDVGVQRIAWARYNDLGLENCGLQVVDSLPQIAAFVLSLDLHYLVIEQMVVYPRSKGDPNDLINISHIVGACAVANPMCETRLVTPAKWKGSLPKKVHHARFLEEMSAAERATLDLHLREVRPSLQHNVIDACALACWLRKGKRS